MEVLIQVPTEACSKTRIILIGQVVHWKVMLVNIGKTMEKGEGKKRKGTEDLLSSSYH